MSDLKHLFVPYELAVKLKEKGFDYNCFAFYDSNNNIEYFCNLYKKHTNNSKSLGATVSPLYQQVVDWFREEHNILISVDNDGREYFYVYTFLKDDDRHILDGYKTYYEALTKAIEEALKLI